MSSIIITGAGTGIGAATAISLAESGDYELILLGRRIEKLESIREKLANPTKHECYSCDVSDPKSIAKAYSQAQLEKKDLVGIFANAGVGGENIFGENDRWGEIIQTNLTGVYHAVMQALPFLKNSRPSTTNIIVTSSILARFGVPNHAAYCASKTGLLGLVRSLAVQYSPDGVLVNAICPGWVETDMAKSSIGALAERQGISYEEAYQTQMGFVPLGKMSQPEEVANVVKFLFSNEEKSITGQALDINNGAFMI